MVNLIDKADSIPFFHVGLGTGWENPLARDSRRLNRQIIHRNAKDHQEGTLVHLSTIYENKYYEEIGEIFTFQNPNVSTIEPADNAPIT